MSSAIGGDNIGETVEGLQRFPSTCATRARCATRSKLRDLPVLTGAGLRYASAMLRPCESSDGPPTLRARTASSGWIYIDLHSWSPPLCVTCSAVTNEVRLPAGYRSRGPDSSSTGTCGAKLRVVVPATLVIIFVLLYMTFRRVSQRRALPSSWQPCRSLVGGFLLMFKKGYNMSVAVSAVGSIALAGVAAEIGVVMLVYPNQAMTNRATDPTLNSERDLRVAIVWKVLRSV